MYFLAHNSSHFTSFSIRRYVPRPRVAGRVGPPAVRRGPWRIGRPTGAVHRIPCSGLPPEGTAWVGSPLAVRLRALPPFDVWKGEGEKRLLNWLQNFSVCRWQPSCSFKITHFEDKFISDFHKPRGADFGRGPGPFAPPPLPPFWPFSLARCAPLNAPSCLI